MVLPVAGASRGQNRQCHAFAVFRGEEDGLDTLFCRKIRPVIIAVFALATGFVLRTPVYAQGGDWPGTESATSGATPSAVQAILGDDGYAHWHLDLDRTCRFADHNYTLDVSEEPTNLSDILLTATIFDVDFRDPKDCEGGPEVDLVTFNGFPLGILTGANNSWSVNPWGLGQDHMVRGLNRFHIYTDATKTGCWCVGVGSIDLRARVGFVITEITPKDGEQHHDFHAGQVGLNVTFSSALDPATVNQQTFLLAYRDRRGAYQQVPGAFSFPAPNQFSFLPSADLKDGVRYYLTVFGGANGVKGAGGSRLDATRTLEFWTVPDLGVSDKFDYGDGRGSRCAPSASPCPGVEIAVFQVARNAALVPGKDSVARLYLRWKGHPEVYQDDQVKEMTVKVDLRLGSEFSYSGIHTVKRPDQYAAAEISAAANTINIYIAPRSAFTYKAEVMPLGAATPIVFTAEKPLPKAAGPFQVHFDHYYLKAGDWKDGVPEATKTKHNGLVRLGAQLTTDMFPFVETVATEKGDAVVNYTVLPTKTTHPTCGTVREVLCTLPTGAKSKRTELDCIQGRMESLLGGHALVTVSVPLNVCPTAIGLQMGSVLYLMDSNKTPPTTVAHEFGHYWGISQKNQPTPLHRNDPAGIEGFQVRTKRNRSRAENLVKPVPIMATNAPQVAGTEWMHNDDYATLLSTTSGSGAQAAEVSSYLIVQGTVDTGAATAALEAVFQQQAPNGIPDDAGPCTAALLDPAGHTLTSVPFTSDGQAIPDLGAIYGPALAPSAATFPAAGPAPFSASLPWQEAAKSLQIACGGTTLLTQSRSAATPAVDFTGLADGDTLSDQVQLSWTGSDADSSDLAYQLQFSGDAGATWTPLMPVGVDTESMLDTTLLPSGPNRGLRVLVTDGFNTAYATRAVTIANPLTVLSQTPEPSDQNVPVDPLLQMLFNTPIDAQTLSAQSVKLTTSWGGVVDITLHLSDDGRELTLQPLAPLAANTSYGISINDGLKDISGANVAYGRFSTGFTTEPDTEAPYVVATYPSDGATGVPRTALVQATLNETLSFGAIGKDTFRLQDAAGKEVSGTAFSSSQASTMGFFRPTFALEPDTTYTATLVAEVSDAAHNPLGAARTWHFTTGPDMGLEAAIVGNYAEQAVDDDGDGLFDRLTIYVDVQSMGGSYDLNGRLIDRNGQLIQWVQADYGSGPGKGSLEAGVQRVALQFDAKVIRAHNVDGPYFVDALNFYADSSLPVPWAPQGDVRFMAYQTLPYAVGQFAGVLSFKPLPDRLLEWNTNREDAWNLRDYTVDLVRPISEVTYSIAGNSDPRVGVSIDAGANIDIHPQPNVEAESDVTIKGCDTANNCAQGTFTVHVQKPRAAVLVATPVLRVPAGETRPLDVGIQDQWQRTFSGGELKLTFTSQRRLGTLTPASVTTTGGHARVMYQAGDTMSNDTVFIVAPGGLFTQAKVNITYPLDLFLPVMRAH